MLHFFWDTLYMYTLAVTYIHVDTEPVWLVWKIISMTFDGGGALTLTCEHLKKRYVCFLTLFIIQITMNNINNIVKNGCFLIVFD